MKTWHVWFIFYKGKLYNNRVQWIYTFLVTHNILKVEQREIRKGFLFLMTDLNTTTYIVNAWNVLKVWINKFCCFFWADNVDSKLSYSYFPCDK
jgi:hypothetical protein